MGLLADAFSPAPLRLSLRTPCGWELPPPLARKLRKSGEVTSYICDVHAEVRCSGRRRSACQATHNGLQSAGSLTMGESPVCGELLTAAVLAAISNWSRPSSGNTLRPCGGSRF